MRVVDTGNYIHETTVRVKGKNCGADVIRKLKPGEKVFKVWDGVRKKHAEVQTLETVWVTCTIE